MGAVVGISQGLGRPMARLVGSWRRGWRSSPCFVLALPCLRSVSDRMQLQRAPAGRPRLCLLLCQQRPWQAGQDSSVGPMGLEACQPWQLPSFHFFRFAQRGDPGVQPSCRPQTKSLPRCLCSPSPGEARTADGKGWATINRTSK